MLLNVPTGISNPAPQFPLPSSMSVTSESKPSLDPPASVAAKLEIPEGKFVLTYDKLDSEAIIQSVRDDTAGAIAVFIGTTRNSFQGALGSFSPYVLFTEIAPGFRSGCEAFRIPGVQQNGRKYDEGHISLRSHKRDSVRSRCSIRTSSFSTATLRGLPPIRNGTSWRSVDRHCGFFAPSKGSFCGLRIPFGTGQTQCADLEDGGV